MTEVMSAFLEGLERVAAVVAKNPKYESILGSKLDKYLPLCSCVSNDEKYKWLFAYLKRRVRNYKPKRYEISREAEVIAWAKTKNNQREVEYFKSLMKKNGYSIDVYNLAGANVVDCLVSDDDIWPFFKMFWERFKKNKEVNISLFHQQLMYVFSCVDFFYSFDRSLSVKLVLLANDHSPIPVALSCVLKHIGIKRVYIQHAEVTDRFPPLDFEYSLLRNYKSLKIYRSIGKVTGKVQISSRRVGRFEYDKLKEANSIKPNEKVNVVIFLTAIYNLEYLIELVNRLRLNDDVGSVFVKPHPSMRGAERKVLDDKSLMLFDEVGEKNFIAIVGNSSVVTELLFEGVPVFQDFNLDDVGVDYYGYVGGGLAFEFSLREFNGRFWENAIYDDDWLDRYSDIEPAVATRRNNALASTESDFVYHILMSIDKIGYKEWLNNKKWETFKSNMFCLTRTYLRYESKHEGKMLGVNDVIRYCEVAFSQRLPEMINIISRVDFDECDTALKVWLLLKKIEWTGYRPDDDSLKKIVDYVILAEHEKSVLARLENMLLSVLIRYKSYELLSHFMSKSKYVDINNLHIHKRIAMSALDFSKVYSVLLSNDVLTQGLSEFHKLKFYVQTGSVCEKDVELCSHDVLIRRFVELSPKSISHEFVSEVMPRYEIIRHKMIYMSVRSVKAERDAVLDSIRTHICARRPFAMIRLSDGEAYFFLDKLKYWNEEDAKNRERHWWGEEVSRAMRKEISLKLYNSLYDIDLIGIPSIYRFIRDYTDKSVTLKGSLTGRGVLEVIHGVSDMNLSACFTEDKANLTLFGDMESIKAISEGANRIVFIGSASDRYIMDLFSGVSSFLYIPVPTHFKTRSNNKYYSGDQSLPYKYKDVIKKIHSVVAVGDVVFVAAGVIGKLFVLHSKYNGAVALDVGSALDQIADANIHSLH